MRRGYKYISLVLITGLIILLIGFCFAKTLQPPEADCQVCYTGAKGYFFYQDLVRKLVPLIKN